MVLRKLPWEAGEGKWGELSPFKVWFWSRSLKFTLELIPKHTERKLVWCSTARGRGTSIDHDCVVYMLYMEGSGGDMGSTHGWKVGHWRCCCLIWSVYDACICWNIAPGPTKVSTSNNNQDVLNTKKRRNISSSSPNLLEQKPIWTWSPGGPWTLSSTKALMWCLVPHKLTVKTNIPWGSHPTNSHLQPASLYTEHWGRKMRRTEKSTPPRRRYFRCSTETQIFLLQGTKRCYKGTLQKTNNQGKCAHMETQARWSLHSQALSHTFLELSKQSLAGWCSCPSAVTFPSEKWGHRKIIVISIKT